MALRYRFNQSSAAKFRDAIRNCEPIDDLKTTDDLITLAAVCLSLAGKIDATSDLGPNPGARSIAEFESTSAKALLPIHGAAQLGRHFLQTLNYEDKFENTVEVEVVPQDTFPFFAPASRILSGAKVENTLDLETSLFFEATV